MSDITLGKLRDLLKSFHEIRMHQKRVPNIIDITEVLANIGCSKLPLSTVEIIFNVIESAGENEDVLALLTLKRLEELMSRIHERI